MHSRVESASGLLWPLSELVIDWGPGYRVYIGKDGKKLVILLGGGTKKRQQPDIDQAKLCWQDYIKQKKEP